MSIRLFGSAFLLAALSGCSSIHDSMSLPQGVTERFTPPAPHTHVLRADHRKAFEAAKAAFKPMDFHVTYAGPNQGKLSALSDIRPEMDLNSSRQIQAEIRLTDQPDGSVEIAAQFKDIVEDDFDKHPGQGVAQPIRQEGIYEVYFKNVDAALVAPPKAP